MRTNRTFKTEGKTEGPAAACFVECILEGGAIYIDPGLTGVVEEPVSTINDSGVGVVDDDFSRHPFHSHDGSVGGDSPISITRGKRKEKKGWDVVETVHRSHLNHLPPRKPEVIEPLANDEDNVVKLYQPHIWR